MFTGIETWSPTKESKSSESLAESLAWWLLTGTAAPTTTTRFIHAGPAASHVRAHVTSQIEKILEAAATVEISDELSALLLRLINQPDK